MHLPQVPMNLETLKIIFPYSLIMAGVGLIETLLTLTLIDEMTETKGQKDRECIGQGIANVVTGFLGGMGGSAVIGQSMINVNSGGRGRLSGLVAGVALLLFIVSGSGLIQQIPIAALIGVMFMVVIATFGWESFRLLPRMPKSDAFILVSVTLITVLTNLAAAALLGVLLAALIYVWNSSEYIYCEIVQEVSIGTSSSDTKMYRLHGQLFFGSASKFKTLFNPATDPDTVVLNLERARIWDHSGVEALEWLAERYKAQGKTLLLSHISPKCQGILIKSGCSIEQSAPIALF